MALLNSLNLLFINQKRKIGKDQKPDSGPLLSALSLSSLLTVAPWPLAPCRRRHAALPRSTCSLEDQGGPAQTAAPASFPPLSLLPLGAPTLTLEPSSSSMPAAPPSRRRRARRRLRPPETTLTPPREAPCVPRPPTPRESTRGRTQSTPASVISDSGRRLAGSIAATPALSDHPTASPASPVSPRISRTASSPFSPSAFVVSVPSGRRPSAGRAARACRVA